MSKRLTPLTKQGKGFPELMSIEQKRERGVDGNGELAMIMTFQSIVSLP